MTRTVFLSKPSAGRCGATTELRIEDGALEIAARPRSYARTAAGQQKKRISLHIGDVAASHGAVVLDTVLGSCVAVCLFDPILRAGGMNHILLPACGGASTPRCGVHAMELLINELMKLGGDRRRFTAKAFGGATVIQGMTQLPVGDKNVAFVRSFLAAEKIPLIAARLGGDHAVHLYFHTDTGKATVHTVDGSILPRIIDSEDRYRISRAGDALTSGEITLF